MSMNHCRLQVGIDLICQNRVYIYIVQVRYLPQTSDARYILFLWNEHAVVFLTEYRNPDISCTLYIIIIIIYID